jgi:hypothetical protein
MASTSSPVILSEGSPVLIIDETDGGFWLLVQGSSCTSPPEVVKVSNVYPFMMDGFHL